MWAASAALALALACPSEGAAQQAAELEIERNETGTVGRVEILDDGFSVLRVESVRSAGLRTDRLGFQLPGRLFDLDGYASLFLERDPDRTSVGTNFELGRGPVLAGGSLERAEGAFTGAYLRFRRRDWDVAFGGGDRNGKPVWHGAAYAKGTRFSLAAGGSGGSSSTAYSHLAGTWHPAPDDRGRVGGGWFALERDGPRDYTVEVNVAHRATFGYLTSWGAYGMDQWPHERRIEALGDIMRYFRPAIRNHERTAGAGVIGARYERAEGASSVTLDGRFYPFRILGGGEAPAPSPNLQGGRARDLRAELLHGVMLGLTRSLDSGPSTLLLELRLDPIVLYGEIPSGRVRNGYYFLQYVVRRRGASERRSGAYRRDAPLRPARPTRPR